MLLAILVFNPYFILLSPIPGLSLSQYPKPALRACVPDSATPWTVAHQSPLSMEFSRQEYWSGFPFPTPGDPPDPGIEPASLISPALAGGSFTAPPLGKPPLFPDRGSNPSSLHWKHRGLNHWTARRVLWIVFRKHIYMSLRLTSQEYFQMLF